MSSSSSNRKNISIAGGVIAGALAVGIGLKNYNARKFNRTIVRKQYDYIIVGGGTAGCVVASRLTENPNISVLILEAGEPSEVNGDILVPAAAPKLQRTSVDWQFKAEKQSFTNNRISNWPRGKVLGGSSCLNWMLWVRGHEQDYNSWVSEHNCEGWSYNDCIPYFKRSEKISSETLKRAEKEKTQLKGNSSDPSKEFSSDQHGSEGEIFVQNIPNPNYYTELFIRAGVESGFPKLIDYNNGKNMFGVSRSQVAINDGKRQHTANAYLNEKVLARKNLHILTNAHVSRVILEGKNNRAVAVEYFKGNFDSRSNKNHNQSSQKSNRHFVLCDREIILCCGAVQSPQILMLSGIGDRKHLDTHNIHCKIDLPGVGKNLKDHLFVPLIRHATRPLTMDFHGIEQIPEIAKYILFNKGPLKSQGLESMAFFNTTKPFDDIKAQQSIYPDCQIHHVVAAGNKPEFNENLGVPNDWNDTVQRGILSLPTLLHPKSIGQIELHNSNPFSPPKIIANYLEKFDDIKVLVEGLKKARKIHASYTYKDYLGEELLDDELAKKYHPSSDKYLIEYVKKWALTVYHPVGTCKMGPKHLNDTVVDHKTLCVHNTIGLRVVDCSVFPDIVSANTYAPVVMVAEKASDLIKLNQNSSNNANKIYSNL